MRSAGVEPEVIVSGVDEFGISDVSPAEHVLILARRKARAVAAALDTERAIVLGCDSMLELDGEVFGKPSSPDVARERWKRMRGSTGILHTGHCLVDTHFDRTAESTGSTIVHFADVTDEEIDAYIATGEPLEVAGAFTVDGLGGAFVTGIDGDYHNVVGVSLPLLRMLLADLDVPWPSLWA